MELGEYKTPKIGGKKRFTLNDSDLRFSILDFWSWNQSDLVENRTRGILAEFLVKQALELKSTTRMEWDVFDFVDESGVKVEVKSSAYIQSWKQNNYSKPSFDIARKKKLLPDNSYSNEASRWADIYIFCLLDHKNQKTIDPMKLEQWTFYIVSTKELDDRLGNQKSLGLSSLKVLRHEVCGFLDLKGKYLKVKSDL